MAAVLNMYISFMLERYQNTYIDESFVKVVNRQLTKSPDCSSSSDSSGASFSPRLQQKMATATAENSTRGDSTITEVVHARTN